MPVRCREEAVWELVVDRARLTGTAVEDKGVVGCFGNPYWIESVRGGSWMVDWSHEMGM